MEVERHKDIFLKPSLTQGSIFFNMFCMDTWIQVQTPETQEHLYSPMQLPQYLPCLSPKNFRITRQWWHPKLHNLFFTKAPPDKSFRLLLLSSQSLKNNDKSLLQSYLIMMTEMSITSTYIPPCAEWFTQTALYVFYKCKDKAGEMAQWLRALVDPLEDPGSIPRVQILA